MKTVYLYQTDELLFNPGKGMVLYNTHDENTLSARAKKDYKRALAYASCLNIKISWIKLQPEREDSYEWSGIDDILSLAKQLGKRVTLGIGCVVGTGGVQEGIRSLVPNWVYEAGAKYEDIDCANYKLGGSNISRIPVWEDAIYRQKYEKLISAVASRYDGNPLIDCVINFSHGNWGEWHYLDINGLPCSKENLYLERDNKARGLEFYRYFVDLFPRYFKKTPLVLPTNIHDSTDELEPWVKYAVDTYSYGLKREGLITIPNCTQKMWYVSGKGPAFGEWQSAYYHYKTDGRWSDELLDRQIIDGALTHYNLGYYGIGALTYVKEKEHQVRYWANRLGYLFKVVSISLPENGEKYASICIRNDGVSRIYLPNSVYLARVDKEGNILEERKIDVDLREIQPHLQKNFTFLYPFERIEGLCIAMVDDYSGKNIQIQNLKSSKKDYYLLESNGYYRVCFDHVPIHMSQVKNEYYGIEFVDSAWRTVLCRDKYLSCLYADNYQNDYTAEIKLKDGNVLTSFTAYGIGRIVIKDENGNCYRVKITEKPKRYFTGFSKPSGSVKIQIISDASCWAVKFVDFVYKIDN